MKKVLFSLLLLISTNVWAETADEYSTPQTNTLALPEDIRQLVRQEMNEVKKGMESLVFFIATGQWQQIEQVGNAVKSTYIMKKTLTPEQMQQLHGALPDGFKRLDKSFHGYAGKLADAAARQDMELVQYYRLRMNQSCTDCHSQFARDRFPGFR